MTTAETRLLALLAAGLRRACDSAWRQPRRPPYPAVLLQGGRHGRDEFSTDGTVRYVTIREWSEADFGYIDSVICLDPRRGPPIDAAEIRVEHAPPLVLVGPVREL